MNRIIKTVVLILLVQKHSTAEAFMDETCEVNREKEQQCRSYTYSVVKPMLDYLHQVSEELQESKAKDIIIKDLREKLVQQEMNEALIKELRSQIDFQKRIDSLTMINKKCKAELASKSAELDKLNVEMKKLNSSLLEKNQEIANININKNNEIEKLQVQNIERLTIQSKLFEECKDFVDKFKKFEICEAQLRNLNNSLIEKDKSISRYNVEIQDVTKYQKTVELQFKESQTKLLKIEKDNQLCEAENDKLNRTLQNIPLDCSPFESNPGIHSINIPGFGVIEVQCWQDGEMWIVILNQEFGKEENFNRDWATYREGFGSLENNFFLGLEKIHRLTSSRNHMAYVTMFGAYMGINTFEYYNFKVSDENSGYALNFHLLKERPLFAKSNIKLHEGTKFTTYDRDNDNNKDNCATLNKFGWWYKDCATCQGYVSRSICGHELQKLTVMIRPF